MNGQAVHLKVDGAYNEFVVLEVDGVDLAKQASIRSVRVETQIDRRNAVHVEMVALAGLDVRLTADIAVQVVAYPGYTVVVEPQSDGSTRYRVVDEGAAS